MFKAGKKFLKASFVRTTAKLLDFVPLERPVTSFPLKSQTC